METGSLNIKIKNKTFEPLEGWDNVFSLSYSENTVIYTRVSDSKLNFVNTLIEDTYKQKPFKCSCNGLEASFFLFHNEWDEREGILQIELARVC